MKNLIIISALLMLILSSCFDINTWNPNLYKTIVLDGSNPFYNFKTGMTYSIDNMPADIDENGIINEFWCTDLPALCGNYWVSDKTSFDEFQKIPSVSFTSNCTEVDLNKVIVFELADGSYALVRIVDDAFTNTGQDCIHTITLEVNYPALVGLEFETEGESDSSISEGTWEFITKTRGLVIDNLSSNHRSGAGLFMGGYVSSSMYAEHVGELRYESTSYLNEITVPGYFTTRDINCCGDFLINICGSAGQFARYDDLSNTWSNIVTVADNFYSRSVYFPDENNGYVASEREIYYSSDGGASWTYKYRFDRAGKIFFTSAYEGFVLESYGTDEGRIFKTTNSGTDFIPYAFPLTWFDQPNANHVNDLHFINSEIGFICADFGQIVKTTDGGEHWSLVRRGSKTDNDLTGIVFPSEMEGWACGKNGTLLRTIDGGINWTVVDLGETDNFIAIEFNSPYCGWVTTLNKIYFYHDREKYRSYFKNN